MGMFSNFNFLCGCCTLLPFPSTLIQYYALLLQTCMHTQYFNLFLHFLPVISQVISVPQEMSTKIKGLQ